MTYTIVAANAGPIDRRPARPSPTRCRPSLTGATWTCVGAVGGTCPAVGRRQHQRLGQSAVGGTATFTVTATISPSAHRHARPTRRRSRRRPASPIRRRATTRRPTPTRSTPTADLSITKTDGVDARRCRAHPVTYTIVATNAGPSTVTGGDGHRHAAGGTHRCDLDVRRRAAAASCPASGSGNISAAVNLPVGGTATFTVTGDVVGVRHRHARQHGDGRRAGRRHRSERRRTTRRPTPTRSTPTADLSITKTDGSATAVPGQPGDLHDRRVERGTERRDRCDGDRHVAGGADRCDLDVRRRRRRHVSGAGSGNISAAVNLPVGGDGDFHADGNALGRGDRARS